MDTDAISANVDVFSIDRSYFTFLYHTQHSRQDFFRIMQYRSRKTSRYQCAIFLICPVRENFSCDFQAVSLGRQIHLTSSRRQQVYAWIDFIDRLANGICDIAIDHRHIVEGAVRFDVLHFHSFTLQECHQRTDLIFHHNTDLIRRKLDLPPSKTLFVIKPGMGSNGDTVFFGHPYGPLHNNRISRMPSACHIYGRNILDDFVVHSNAV